MSDYKKSYKTLMLLKRGDQEIGEKVCKLFKSGYKSNLSFSEKKIDLINKLFNDYEI